MTIGGFAEPPPRRQRTRISVVVPAYNAFDWIEETLTSVLAQTVPPHEIIVVDDGSTDGTSDLLRGWTDRVRVIGQDNKGCGEAFNTGFREASGDFVALCPADDLWVPTKLEWQLATLRQYPQVDVSFGAAATFGDATRDFPSPRTAGVQDPTALLREMYIRDVIADPSVVVRRSLHGRLGGFVKPIGEDYEFWMRAIKAGAVFHYDPRTLVRLRQHGGNLSSNAVAIWRMNLHVHRTYAAEVDNPALVRRTLAGDLATLARCHLGLDEITTARALYRESLTQRVTLAATAGVLLAHVPALDRALPWLNRRRRGAHRSS